MGVGKKLAEESGDIIVSALRGIGIPPRDPEIIRTGEFDPRYDSRVLEKDRVENTTRKLQYLDNPQIDEVPLSAFEGRPFVTAMSDRTMAGATLSAINDVNIQPVPLQGGQGFMFRNPGQAWASAKSIVRRMQSGAKKGGEDTAIFLPFRMSPSGGDYAMKTGMTMLAYNAVNMNKRQKGALNKAVKERFPKWPGIDSDKAFEFLGSLNGPDRSRFLKDLDLHRNDGGLSLGQARVSVVDPEQMNAEDFRLMNVGEVDANAPLVEDSGHITYKTGLPGQGIGRIRDAEKISPFDLMPVGGKGQAITAADPLNPTTKEGYTLRQQPEARGFISEDVLKRLQERGVDVGSADPTLLAGIAAGSGAAMLAPEVSNEIESRVTRRVRGGQYRQRTAQRERRFADLKSKLLEGVASSTFVRTGLLASELFDSPAMDVGQRGLLGAVRAGQELVRGSGLDPALQAGANVVNQPIDVTADQAGQYMLDATGSPVAATAANVATQLADPSIL